MDTAADPAPVVAALRQALGADHVRTDAASCAYVSQDVYREAPPPAAVVAPQDKEALRAAVRIATDHGWPVWPRGGGYSYTDAYLPSRPGGLSLDLRGLNAIEDINVEDGYVTVQAGCTWQALDEALKPHGVRAEFWGPLSGANATIGGAISQGALSLGSGKHGVSAEAVLGLEIVTANGGILRTGSAAQAGKSPFFRYYGPDLTGIFCGDAGALGVKASVTLRLRPRARLAQGLSFGFADFPAAAAAFAAVARTGRVTESFGFTRHAMEAALASPGLWHDMKLMFAVGRAAGGPLAGLAQMARMALAGRRFVSQAQFFMHLVVEADNAQELRGQIAVVRAAVGGLGKDLPNTMPTVMRAQPFMPYPVVSQDSKRLLPIHGILPFSQTVRFHEAITGIRARHAEAIAREGVVIPAMFTTIGTHAFLYEPVFYWPDCANSFHEQHADDALLAPMRAREPNLSARALVEVLKGEMVDAMHACGGGHLQIGKMYPFLRDRDASQVALLRRLKAEIDPQGLINPGALGLE